MRKKRAIVSVINDLVTDQRVNRTCSLLDEMGFHVTITGRRLPQSLPLPDRPFYMHRRSMIFTKGALFYAFFNIRLFFFLLFKKCDLLYSNDLDTLLPNYLVSRIKKVKLIYDTHEYFTGVPELVNRPRIRKVWERIEGKIFPKLSHIITVNESISGIYEEKYRSRAVVVRNVPVLYNDPKLGKRVELGLPDDKKILILQGSGINVQRGAEEAVEAMRYIDDVLLLIIGSGDVIDILKTMATDPDIKSKVKFIQKLPFEKLYEYTSCADAGLTIDKETNLNYKYSLPNKLFDYIGAGIPVLASDLPEITKIVKGYDIGLIIKNHDPAEIAENVKSIMNSSKRGLWKKNLKKAAGELNWENEKEYLRAVVEDILS